MLVKAAPEVGGVGHLGVGGMCRIRSKFPLEQDMAFGDIEIALQFADKLDEGAVLSFADGSAVEVADETDADRVGIRRMRIIAGIRPANVRSAARLS